MRKPPYLGLAIAAGVILLLSILAFRSYLPYVGSDMAPKQPPAIILAMHNAHFVGMGKKGRIWSLNADRVEIGQDRSTTTLTKVTNGEIYDAGKVALKVEAGEAAYNSIRQDLLMRRGIRITGSGQRVIADGAEWNSATSTLRSNGRVRFDGNWYKATTDSVLVDMKNREMTMHNVNMSIDLSKQGVKLNAF